MKPRAKCLRPHGGEIHTMNKDNISATQQRYQGSRQDYQKQKGRNKPYIAIEGLDRCRRRSASSAGVGG